MRDQAAACLEISSLFLSYIQIFHPEKRSEVWRYLTYMFIHSGLFHIVFNILVQLILGIPLEMVHGKLFLYFKLFLALK